MLARPVSPGRLQRRIFVPLTRGGFQLDQCLLGGDHRFAAAGPNGRDHQIHHSAAGLVQIEARAED
jgi:hypothetical protein